MSNYASYSQMFPSVRTKPDYIEEEGYGRSQETKNSAKLKSSTEI